jgi:hypothetical protein
LNTLGGDSGDVMQLRPQMTAEMRPKRIEFDGQFQFFPIPTIHGMIKMGI